MGDYVETGVSLGLRVREVMAFAMGCDGMRWAKRFDAIAWEKLALFFERCNFLVERIGLQLVHGWIHLCFP